MCKRNISIIITYHGINNINQENFEFYPTKISNFHHNNLLINEKHTVVCIQIPFVHSLKFVRNSANSTHNEAIPQ